MRIWRVFLLCAALLVPSTAHAATWTRTVIHLDWATARHSVGHETYRYSIVKAHLPVVGYRVTTVRRSPHVLVRTRYPIFQRPVAPVLNSYKMLVTWYAATGHAMANGQLPQIGDAACGYEIPLGTHVRVPGVGILLCGDRVCAACPGIPSTAHIDVFGINVGSSYRIVQVLR